MSVCCCVCVFSYGDCLLVVRQDAALSLQVSLLLPEQQLKAASLLLLHFHTSELVVHGSLQGMKREGS